MYSTVNYEVSTYLTSVFCKTLIKGESRRRRILPSGTTGTPVRPQRRNGRVSFNVRFYLSKQWKKDKIRKKRKKKKEREKRKEKKRRERERERR